MKVCVEGEAVDPQDVYMRVMNFGQPIPGRAVQRYELTLKSEELFELLSEDLGALVRELRQDEVYEPDGWSEKCLNRFKALGYPSVRELWRDHPGLLADLVKSSLYDRLLDKALSGDPIRGHPSYVVNSVDAVLIEVDELRIVGDAFQAHEG